MNNHFTKSTIVKIAFLFVLISGSYAVIAQENGNSSAELLSKAAQETSQAQSYTMKQSKIMSKEISQRKGGPMKNEIIGEIRYEKPYFFMKMHAGSGGTQKNRSANDRSNNKQMTIGKIDPESGSRTFYIKSVLSGNKWENMNKLPFLNNSFLKIAGNKNCVMCGNLSDPEKRFKNISLAGSETINGKECYKIMAKIRESAMNKNAPNMLKGPMNKMVSDFTMDVLSSRITYWIRKKSKLIEKVNSHMKQKIVLTVDIGGKKQTRSIQQTSEEILNYTKYNNTTVPEKYKQKYDELQHQDEVEKSKR